WDKTFLDILHLDLARRTHFRLYGGTRFGGTVTLEDAFDRYGFHHIALAAGAGKPTVIGLKNNLIRGVRKASDFLMALQLTGAFKKGSLASLQVRLPAVVIGGGLTAIDAATELAAGTGPNTTVEKEAPGRFEVDPEHSAFSSFRIENGKLVPAEVTDDLTGAIGFFTSHSSGGRYVSFFGDNHPAYAGSVVKAMAS